MAITTLSQYFQAQKQEVLFQKANGATTVSFFPFSMFNLTGGTPATGTLAGTNTANGVVPTDADVGYPSIDAIDGANTLYLTKAIVTGGTLCHFSLYDRLFVAGAYAFNANTALTAQPSYAGRVPGADYTQCEIWVEQVTVATGNQAVTVTYTNENGVTGRTTGAVGIGGAPTLGRCWQLPLQAGDKGVQKIESVVGSVATAGTFNVMVLRPLAKGLRIGLANTPSVFDIMQIGRRQLFADSALYILAYSDTSGTGTPHFRFELSNG